MQLFVVVASSNPEKIATVIRAIGVTHLEFKKDCWLVAYEGTTRDLAIKLGIRPGTTGSGLVCSISTYSGRASPEVWEWLKVHWPQNA